MNKSGVNVKEKLEILNNKVGSKINTALRTLKKIRYGLREDDFFYIDHLPFWCLTLKEKNYLIHWVDFFFDRKKYSLQKKVFKVWEKQKKEWNKLIYWAGWFYQSLNYLHLYGWRSSEKRIEIYKLKEYLNESDRVLDVGANLGAIPIILHKYCKKWVCIEPNDYLFQINKLILEDQQIKNIEFITKGFEEYEPEEKFNVIFSFASHATGDGNSKLPLQNFFNKIYNHLTNNGLLLFESHMDEIDNIDNYKKVLEIIESQFTIIDRYTFNSPELTYDYQKNVTYREFIVARKRS